MKAKDSVQLPRPLYYILLVCFISVTVVAVTNVITHVNTVSLAQIQADPSLVGLCRCPSPCPTEEPTPAPRLLSPIPTEDMSPEGSAEAQVSSDAWEKAHKNDFIAVPRSRLGQVLPAYHGYPVKYYGYRYPQSAWADNSDATLKKYDEFYNFKAENEVIDPTVYDSQVKRDVFLRLDPGVFDALHQPFPGIAVVCSDISCIANSEFVYVVWDRKHFRPLPFNFPSHALVFLKTGKMGPYK